MTGWLIAQSYLPIDGHRECPKKCYDITKESVVPDSCWKCKKKNTNNHEVGHTVHHDHSVNQGLIL